MLEQAVIPHLVDVRGEVIEREVVDDGLVGSYGLLHALVPDLHPLLVAVRLPVGLGQVHPGAHALYVGPQVGDRAHRSVDQSRSVVVALDVEFTLHLRGRPVRDVHDGVLH